MTAMQQNRSRTDFLDKLVGVTAAIMLVAGITPLVMSNLMDPQSQLLAIIGWSCFGIIYEGMYFLLFTLTRRDFQEMGRIPFLLMFLYASGGFMLAHGVTGANIPGTLVVGGIVTLAPYYLAYEIERRAFGDAKFLLNLCNCQK